jgi:hypothetical protein
MKHCKANRHIVTSILGLTFLLTSGIIGCNPNQSGKKSETATQQPGTASSPTIEEQSSTENTSTGVSSSS